VEKIAKAIIIENMQRRIFHGILSPTDIAQALLAEFNHGNMHAQVFGKSDKMAVQIGTHPGAASGGKTALTVTLQQVSDGIMVELGQQAWLGVAASLGQTAFSVFRNPFNLIGRLDDLAQDIENLQLSENVWQVIARTAASAGASHQLSDRMSRLTCDFCGTANPIGEPACIACGAPLGNAHPSACRSCGFVVLRNEGVCPNCGQQIYRLSD
jgi:predicted RNA-binding Zn-ribbon protein involved in translation (DUF1610 family)